MFNWNHNIFNVSVHSDWLYCKRTEKIKLGKNLQLFKVGKTIQMLQVSKINMKNWNMKIEFIFWYQIKL